MASVFGGATPLKLSGAVAGAGLTVATAQYKFVKFSADNTVVLCAATTDVPCGVLQEPVNATGDPVDVVVVGSTPVQASTTISAGAALSTDGSGRAVTAVAGQFVVGAAQNVAGATTAGTLITAIVNCANPTVV